MIRVLTAEGFEDFEDADAYSIGAPNPPQQEVRNSFTNVTTYFPFETLPGCLRLWKVDPTGGDDHDLVALFSPTGWVALDFRNVPEPPPQIEVGFHPSRHEEVEP